MIVTNKNICGGSPIINGTRITVSVVLANIKDEISFEEICNCYQISKEDIIDCIEFAICKLEQ